MTPPIKKIIQAMQNESSGTLTLHDESTIPFKLLLSIEGDDNLVTFHTENSETAEVHLGQIVAISTV